MPWILARSVQHEEKILCICFVYNTKTKCASESSRSLGNGLNIFVMLQQAGCFIHAVRGSFMIVEEASEQQEVLLKD